MAWAARVAGGAVVAAVAGAASASVALVATPGPWTSGYVSETGVDGQPHALAYRIGMAAIALAVALLAGALKPIAGRAAGLLAAAAVLAGASGSVPCSAGCPLPPYEPLSGPALAHGGASILGIAACAFAMVALATTPRVAPRLRRWAAGGAAVTFPVAAAVGLAMLLAGRGPVTGALERLLLATTIAWLIGAAALRATAAATPAGPDATAQAPAAPGAETRRTMASSERSTSSIGRSG